MSVNRRTWSVIICSYTEERWDALVSSIKSALAQQPRPDEVVVVVDHNEALHDRIYAAFGSSIRLVSNQTTQGLSGARNTGVSAATGSHVAFLDDDAHAPADWLSELDSAFDRPRVVGAGGAVEPAWSSARPRWMPDEFLWVVGCSYLGLPGEGAVIRNPIGANMAFARQPVIDAGGFDSRLGRIGKHPAGCEETDLSIRVTGATGGVVVHHPRATVNHQVPAERTSWSYFRRRCFAEGRSKAILAGDSGVDSATSSERSYVTRVLTRGIARRIVRTITHLDGTEFVQALAIGAGLAATASGFLTGTVLRFLSTRSEAPRSPRDIDSMIPTVAEATES